ncbi:hypothetical protein ACWDXD_09890 [Streptomyces sp. NPDC003314]
MSVDESKKTVSEPVPASVLKPRRWVLCLVSGLAGVAIGAASVGLVWWLGEAEERPSGPAFTAAGTVTVFGSWVNAQEDEGCVGIDGFADLRPGATVQIFDLAGHELAQGRLGNGTPGKVVGDSCTWPLDVPGVPSGADQYELQITDRARLTKTREELQNGVDLSFGTQ